MKGWRRYSSGSLFIFQEIESHKHSVVCQDNPGQTSGYKIGVSRSPHSELLDWDTFSSIKSLTFHIKSLLDQTSTKYHEGFIIIQCDLGQDQEALQILMIPPRLERKSSTSRSHVNVNLVLLEDTSREMVFTQLPETVRLMRELNTAGSSRTEVVDLTRVQDLAEGNRAALMSPGLLSEFSRTRHQIIWQTADCPANRSDLLTSQGVSRAFCQLEVPAEVATSLLLSAAALQDSVLASNHYSHLQVVALPWLSSAEDSMLSQYLQAVSSHPNTLTVLTSLSSSHPALPLPTFLLIPHRVRSLLPDLSWRSLLQAQHKLTSLHDLQLTLNSLAALSSQSSQSELSVSPSPAGLLSPLPARHCSSLARPQFDCVCRPRHTRLEEAELRAGLAELITQLHNLQLSRSTDTVCARLRLARVLQADINTYSSDNNFYRIILVLGLVADNQEENLETVIAGTVDLQVESQTLRLDQWRLGVGDQRSQTFGCLQQYSSIEENRLSVLRAVERERATDTSLLQNIFNENTVDCLWLLTRQFGPMMKLVELYSACLSEVEVVLELKPCDDTLAWREGEQRTLIGSGETALINVCMVELEGGKSLDCQTTVTDIRYLDGGDDDDNK